MTPGARLQAAIEILDQAFAAPLPPDAILDAYFRRRRYAGSGDRRAVRARVFGVLRRKARLTWNLEKVGASFSTRLLALADLIVGDGLAADDAAALFGASPHAPEALAETERRAAAALQGGALDDPAMPDRVRGEYPEWLDGSLRAAFGRDLARVMAALNAPAPLDLRANVLKTTREAAREALAAEKFAAIPTPFAPSGLRVEGRPRVQETRAFKQGLIEIQDEGSQLVAALVGARPGLTVVDYCAGAGGKTLALAASMAVNQKVAGRLIACDSSAERLARMNERLIRAGAAQVERLALTGDAPPGELANAADRVLVDAPCSGSGAWRRDPLAKWRLGADRLAELVRLQQNILRNAARLVRPGGRLVYATCSVLPEENEAQIGFFLGRDHSFQIVPVAEAWRGNLEGPFPGGGSFLRLDPANHGTDGFFVAVLERAPAAG
jgi:16S rRNA (cytosine967-C5)-methyltransferase